MRSHMGPDPELSHEQPGPISRGNLRSQVTSRILKGVFQGRLRSGQRLIVQGLAKAHGVSPTPVREALVELASMGIVDLLPNRGAVVRSFGAQEVEEISEIRRLLEVEATRRSWGRIEPAELDALESDLARLAARAHDQEWDREIRTVDTRLHGVIAESCGLARLTAEIGRYSGLFRALRDVSHGRDAWTNYSRSNDIPEHRAIVRALRSGDAEDAARAMDRHIRSAASNLIAVMFGDGTGSGIPPEPDSVDVQVYGG